MANINTLKALYQPISAKATQNVLADVSAQERDLARQKQAQQNVMKSVMSIGGQIAKDIKGLNLAKKAGFGVDMEALAKNPKYEKHIRAGGTPQSYFEEFGMPEQTIGQKFKDLIDWRDTTDIERKAYHTNALQGNVLGAKKEYDNTKTGYSPSLSTDYAKEMGWSDQNIFERFEDKRNVGEKWIDEQYGDKEGRERRYAESLRPSPTKSEDMIYKDLKFQGSVGRAGLAGGQNFPLNWSEADEKLYQEYGNEEFIDMGGKNFPIDNSEIAAEEKRFKRLFSDSDVKPEFEDWYRMSNNEKRNYIKRLKDLGLPEDEEFTNKKIEIGKDTNFDEWGDWTPPPRVTEGPKIGLGNVPGVKPRTGLKGKLNKKITNQKNIDQQNMANLEKSTNSAYLEYGIDKIIPKNEWEKLNLGDKSKYIREYVQQMGIPKEPIKFNKGGLVEYYADGGKVEEGQGKEDDVLALLKKDETVINKEQLNKIEDITGMDANKLMSKAGVPGYSSFKLPDWWPKVPETDFPKQTSTGGAKSAQPIYATVYKDIPLERNDSYTKAEKRLLRPDEVRDLRAINPKAGGNLTEEEMRYLWKQKFKNIGKNLRDFFTKDKKPMIGEGMY
tara:strand:+ start:685 stop:2520 length:1836 start_codon:yes stop_codon:yes gene_type:complete